IHGRAGHVCTRPLKALDQSEPDWIVNGEQHDRDSAGYPFCSDRSWSIRCQNDFDFGGGKFCHQPLIVRVETSARAHKIAVKRQRCPLWVKSRHMQCKRACPLYPRKRTCALQLEMAALGHKRTYATQKARSAPRRRTVMGTPMTCP